MKTKGTVFGIIFFYLPDIFLILFITAIYFSQGNESRVFYRTLIMIIFGIVVLRTFILSILSKYFYFNRLHVIRDILSNFKKGKFHVLQNRVQGNDLFAKVLKELIKVGRHLDSMVSSQKDEIDIFHEFYNSIVFSPNSFFLILSENEKVEYVNEGFCRRLRHDPVEIIGKGIEDIFYFVNARLKGAIIKAKSQGETIVLEQTHLLSKNRIPLIFDMKISRILVKGRNKIIILIDDITNKLRKDYQINLISQLSSYLQRDRKIEEFLFKILTAVTSGHGLGFNRAMLYLVDEEGLILEGKMAVGPDSMEEAIEIWNSDDTDTFNEEFDLMNLKGAELFDSVIKSRVFMNSDALLSKALNEKTVIHINDSWHDERVDDELKKLLNVNEFVVVPLFVANTSVGIIIADNKFNQVPISSDVKELLVIFAAQAALTIESHSNLLKAQKDMEMIEKRQDAIVESEKMAAVGKIATHIAHEIRNPLVTMGGYARKIMSMPKDGIKNTTNIVKFSEIILEESERLEKTLSNVMDFTKPSRYIREFNNINDIIRDTVNLLKNLFLDNKIEVVSKLDNEIPLIKCDSNQIKQVMLNLLQNSIEITPPEGIIEIVTEFDSKQVTIRVKDSGTGIDEKDPNVVFEPFFTKKITGVGLGLANVKKIISDHNGSIDVRNREFVGVEFTIQLPLLG
jgi:signal transduction histidine kinase